MPFLPPNQQRQSTEGRSTEGRKGRGIEGEKEGRTITALFSSTLSAGFKMGEIEGALHQGEACCVSAAMLTFGVPTFL